MKGPHFIREIPSKKVIAKTHLHLLLLNFVIFLSYWSISALLFLAASPLSCYLLKSVLKNHQHQKAPLSITRILNKTIPRNHPLRSSIYSASSVQDGQTREQVPKEAGGSPSMQICRTQLAITLSNLTELLQVALLWAWGWTRVPQRPYASIPYLGEISSSFLIHFTIIQRPV